MSRDLIRYLESAGVKFLRLVFCDNANIIRAKAIHLGILADNLAFPVSITIAQQALPVMFDGVVSETGLGPVGEAWLVPDWSTLQILPYATTHARVMANIVYNDQPWSLCPRHFLRQAIASAQKEGLKIKAAFENEFTLLRSNDEQLIPTDKTVFASTLSMDTNYKVVDAIVDALLAQDMIVERYYPESAFGQQEITIRYDEALKSADNQIMFRETVHGIAMNHNLTASFMPKIFAEQAGNGCHLHLSLWQDDQNITGDSKSQISPLTQNFMAGILNHLPALMALTTPCTNSYRRIQPHYWSGAFSAWGYDNREGAIRVPHNPTSPTPTHWELKTCDASANPYIALGAVIYAGLDGIRRNLPLSPGVDIDPGLLSSEKLTEYGIKRLPANLGEAITNLKSDRILLDNLGEEFSRVYIAVREAEWKAMKDMDLDAEVNLLWQRY